MVSNDARGPSRVGRTLSRRDFLKVSGAGIAGMTALATAGCGGSGQGDSGTVTYAEGPDDTGTLQKLLDGFNKKYEGKYKVEYREMPADTQSYLNKLVTELQAGKSDVDVIAGDVIWAAQLAANGWLMDLSDRFAGDLQGEFIPGNVRSNEYEGKIWGVPFVTGAGLLYYRKDLLEKSGFPGPPETWDELKRMALRAKRDSGTRFGFVFQGANYEGGVCNALEYIWNYGGDVLDPDDPTKVVVDSPEAVAGLSEYSSMISDGVTTRAMTTYKEEEAQAAFLRGDAVFMRNWSYVYALTSDPTQSEIKPEQVGILISCTHRLVPRCRDFVARRCAFQSPSKGLRSPSAVVPPPGSFVLPRPTGAAPRAHGSDTPNAPTGRRSCSTANSDRRRAYCPVRTGPN